MESRRVIGKRITRVDGVAKASGKAKYNSDVRPQGTIHAAVLHCPHAHARVRSIDTSEAERLPGVTAVRVTAPAGTVIQWSGFDVAYVAANTEEIARDAVRRIKVDYEPLPHLVGEADLARATARAKPSGEQVSGDPDRAFKEAEVVMAGKYGIPVITHCCLEPHGQTVAWQGDKIEYWPSTQAVSPIGGDLAKNLQLPTTNVHVQMDYIGGGFGSKFSADRWGVEAAQLSKASGGKPVKLYLDRAAELTIAGVRPSLFAEIRLAAKKDGTITGWESRSWSTGGVGGGGIN
ncbi:MAG: xanthine dehydrogenase family protein molybdopterin-binding subunit, partial [Bryobacteraceae bacterium]